MKRDQLKSAAAWCTNSINSFVFLVLAWWDEISSLKIFQVNIVGKMPHVVRCRFIVIFNFWFEIFDKFCSLAIATTFLFKNTVSNLRHADYWLFLNKLAKSFNFFVPLFAYGVSGQRRWVSLECWCNTQSLKVSFVSHEKKVRVRAPGQPRDHFALAIAHFQWQHVHPSCWDREFEIHNNTHL